VCPGNPVRRRRTPPSGYDTITDLLAEIDIAVLTG